MVCFHIQYNAILFRPFKNEVIDLVVRELDHQVRERCKFGINPNPNPSRYPYPDPNPKPNPKPTCVSFLTDGDHDKLGITAGFGPFTAMVSRHVRASFCLNPSFLSAAT
jgi:hypothetical protein